MVTVAGVQAQILALGGRLSGSRAYGRPRPDSDWDYWMPERAMKRLVRWFDANGVRWYSAFMGSATCQVQGVQIEVSDLFPRNARQYRAMGSRQAAV